MQAYNKVANGPLYFGIPLTNIQNSLITLSVKADSLSLVVNASPGKIMFAQVSPAAAAKHTAESGVLRQQVLVTRAEATCCGRPCHCGPVGFATPTPWLTASPCPNKLRTRKAQAVGPAHALAGKTAEG